MKFDKKGDRQSKITFEFFDSNFNKFVLLLRKDVS